MCKFRSEYDCAIAEASLSSASVWFSELDEFDWLSELFVASRRLDEASEI